MPYECQQNKRRIWRFLENVLPIYALALVSDIRLVGGKRYRRCILACEANAFIKNRGRSGRQVLIRMVGDNCTALFPADEMNGEKIQEK